MHMKQQCPPLPAIFHSIECCCRAPVTCTHRHTADLSLLVGVGVCMSVCHLSATANVQHCTTQEDTCHWVLPPDLRRECAYQPSGMSSYPDWGQSLEQVKTQWTVVQEVTEYQRNNTSRIWLCSFYLIVTLVSYCLAECTLKYKNWILFAKHLCQQNSVHFGQTWALS